MNYRWSIYLVLTFITSISNSACAESIISKSIYPASLPLKTSHPMKVTLNTKVEDNKIEVHTRYDNLSEKDILLIEGPFGIFPENTKKIYNGALDEFEIIEQGELKPLKFNGLLVSYGAPLTKEENFTAVAPGEIVSSLRTLGPMPSGPLQGRHLYVFLPGTHDYEIRAKYMIFDEEKNAIVMMKSESTTFRLTMPAIPQKAQK